MLNKLLVILGTTSTGKTDLGLKLAKKFDGELISCDSRQVYKGLDIGTGKLPRSGIWEVRRGNKEWEVGGIKIWMYDVVEPNKQYTVYHYVKDASWVIDGVLKRGKLPIIVGGTGFYLKALLEGIPNLAFKIDPKLRKHLDKLSLTNLQSRMQKVSANKWDQMNNSDRQNPRRLIRAIEIATFNKMHGIKSTQLVDGGEKAKESDVFKIGLTASREIIYRRIDQRVISRINQGMVKEAKYLHETGLSFKRMKTLGLEYGVLADYLKGEIDKEELIKILQGKIHNFARRQITWFKKEKGITWFDIENPDFLDKIENLIKKWYYSE